tara:strand:+ start:647 stop:1675 length:1029 start_codon:yes stop_codon:yes gene_type:complete
MFLSNIKQKIKKKLTLQTPSILVEGKNKIFNKYNNTNNTSLFSFGEKNPDKFFYIIKITPGAGLFSNVLFVLNHLKLAKKKNYIPFVDMQNFPTIYNESQKIHNTFNAWEYFFENYTSININEIYQSKNVFIASNLFQKDFFKDTNTDDLREYFRDNLKVNQRYKKIINFFSEKHFKNKKVLGVHFRGTSYKRSPGHPLPATKKQILKKIYQLQLNESYDKIFFVTEEENYKNFLVSNLSSKSLFLKSSYRSDKNDAFEIYPRRLHRFKLGREALLEAMLLSKCDALIYITSNISSASIAWNLNTTQKRIKIDNGSNSNNVFLAQILWYIKKRLPVFLGGFK